MSNANQLAAFSCQATGSFLTPTANVAKVCDRLLIGTATQLDTTTTAPTTGDWSVTGAFGAVFNISEGGAQLAVGSVARAASGSQPINLGISSQVRSSDLTGATGPGLSPASIGISSIVLDDNSSTYGCASYGYFAAVMRKLGATGTASIGMEIDSSNFVSTVANDPYSFGGAGTTATMWLNVGGGATTLGGTFFPVSVGLGIITNNPGSLANVTYDKGIMIGHNAITINARSNTTGTAIAMSAGHAIEWWASAGTKGGAIYSTNTTSNVLACDVQFAYGGVNFNETSTSQIGVQVQVQATNTGYLLLQGGVAAGYSQIQAYANSGSGNQDLSLLGLGTGLVRFGTYTNSTIVNTGYITIKDAGGTSRRLMVG